MLRLGDADRRLGGIGHLRHQLDVVATVCALVSVEPNPVQAWLPESIAADAGAEAVRPDSIVALQADTGSGVLCLEIDEATEHAPQIHSKLAAYERVRPHRPGWHVMFVVPTDDRLAWRRRVGRQHGSRLGGRVWATVLPTSTHP